MCLLVAPTVTPVTALGSEQQYGAQRYSNSVQLIQLGDMVGLCARGTDAPAFARANGPSWIHKSPYHYYCLECFMAKGMCYSS